MTMKEVLLAAAFAALPLAAPAQAWSVEPLQSPRMERAKDFIADEQWLRAIEELRAAAADKKASPTPTAGK